MNSIIWNRLKKEENAKFSSIHQMTGDIAGNLLNEVIKKESTDNLTSVIIALNGLKCFYQNTEIINNTAMTIQNIKPNKFIPIPKQDEKENKEKALLFNKFTKTNQKPANLVLFNNIPNNSLLGSNKVLIQPPKSKDINMFSTSGFNNSVIERGNLTTKTKEHNKLIIKN